MWGCRILRQQRVKHLDISVTAVVIQTPIGWLKALASLNICDGGRIPVADRLKRMIPERTIKFERRVLFERGRKPE
jgi:hypothetical protein